MLFGSYRFPPHSKGGSIGGTRWDLIRQGPSLPTDSPPLTTTSQPITEEDLWVLPQVQWGRIPLQVSLLGHEELKTPFRVKRGLSFILRKVCILLTLLPSSPDYIPVGIEAPVTTKSGFCRPAYDIHIFNGNKINIRSLSYDLETKRSSKTNSRYTKKDLIICQLRSAGWSI